MNYDRLIESDSSKHWIVEAVVSQGHPIADQIDVSDAKLGDIWLVVARACKLEQQELSEAIARHFNLRSYVGIQRPDASVIRLIPESMARKLKVVALLQENSRLLVAVSDPRDPDLRRQLAKTTQMPIELCIAPPDIIENWLLQGYAPSSANTAVFYQPGTSGWTLPSEAQEAPVVQLTAEIFGQAVKQGATDIHVQPFLGGGLVRFRVDGLLRRVMTLPVATTRRVVNRIKAVARMNIADSIHPQDGRARLELVDGSVDLRISTVPVEAAEKLVIRLLGSGQLPAFSDLGFIEPERSQVKALLTRREGIAFVTGPTGSGKTTTLQACLAMLNRPEYNIITAENPVEYRVPGLTQIEIAPERGFSYAQALRAILRQDPNLILVGEIRDQETAEIAVESALTGHPVLTTLHTPSAVGVIPRLLELGIPRTVLADSFGGATGQRLLRRMCPLCTVEAKLPYTDIENRFHKLSGIAFKRSMGCQSCGYTGYHGRIPVAQVLLPSQKLRDSILNPMATYRDLERVAFETGMRTLSAAVADIIQAGITTPEEAARVLGGAFWSELSSQARLTGVDINTDFEPVIELTDLVGMRTNQPSVLIVGKRLEQRKELIEQVQGQVVEAVEAGTVIEARRALIGQALFAAIILDVNGGHDAFTLLDEFGDMTGPMGLPVIAVADHLDGEMQKLIESGGIDRCLQRPLDSPEYLVSVVGEVLDKRATSLDTGSAFLDFLDGLPEG